MSILRADTRRLLSAASLVVIAATCSFAPSPAMAQAGRAPVITVPPMPLDQALQEIGSQAGTKVRFDPDAVKALTSRPVRKATSVRAAIEAAIAGSSLTIEQDPDGSFTVYNAIVVTAQRDEAETSVLVRQSSTSDRNGLSLRNQPRNTQVISAKAIEDQQALTITDVLRNAGGVSGQLNSPGSGSGYTVRGFSAGGLVNGLSGAATFGVQSGASQPVANIERVEVLKGPDALLSGFDNQGGNVNVVTKKPSAETRLAVGFDVGSYGLLRGVIDANTAISKDKKLSGRVIASGQTMDHSYGGYLGNTDVLFAPSVRFKDSRTDILLGASLSETRTGIVPFTVFNRQTRQILERDPSLPIYSGDQSIRVATSRFYFDATREIIPGIELVARGLHERSRLGLDVYPLSFSNSRNRWEVAVRSSGQQGVSKAVDAFLRFNARIGDTLTARFNVGYNYSTGYFEPLSSSEYNVVGPVSLTENTLPVRSRPSLSTDPSFRLASEQQGIYGQALIQVWKLRLLAGVRRNWYKSTFIIPGFDPFPPDEDDATSPSAGVIFDVMDNVSVFANYMRGVSPVTSTDASGNRLPNIKTTNKEVGVKVDLFNKRAVINASYFDLTQDNTLINDPANPGFSIPAPGQRGRGIDLNVVGEPLPGWTVQASLTRTKYEFLTLTPSRTTVFRQPRDTFSIYSNYRTQIATDISGGVGVGLFGRSSSFADQLGRYVVPAARQVDANIFMTIGGFDINLGIRNLFDRRNYNITTSNDFVPVDEPRNVRLSISKRIF